MLEAKQKHHDDRESLDSIRVSDETKKVKENHLFQQKGSCIVLVEL